MSSNQKSSIQNQKSALVLGGGVAGIAAAVRLAGRGVAVTLVEMRPRLGGRATSLEDPETGGLIDNCQHVTMRCCTALTELYETLGVAGRVAWHGRYHFVHADDTADTLAAGPLPAPLHLAGSFLRFRGLSFGDKWAIGRALVGVRRMKRADREALNTITFASWLEQQRQPPRAVERFWEPTVVGACNETVEAVAAGYALQIFADGLLAGRRGYEMGLSDVPLARLYDPAEAAVTAAGGRLLRPASLRGLDYDPDTKRVTAARLADGTRLTADAFVSALPFEALDRVIDDPLRRDDERLGRLGELHTSPILGLHLWVCRPDRRPVLERPHVVLTGSPIHWFFDHGTDADGVQHLHGVVSAAHDLIDRPNAETLDLALAELQRVAPVTDDVELVRGRVIKERRATFSARPGVDALRPATTGTVRNLLLAGDWTATGWPATMEGAARSGFTAADAVA
ncbi:MAG: hydroxysqualene dehydroxylase HpnE [Planctomycetota bacterium]